MAPYRSEAQRRFFHLAERKGKIKPSIVKEFDESSKGIDLPESSLKDKEGKSTWHKMYKRKPKLDSF